MPIKVMHGDHAFFEWQDQLLQACLTSLTYYRFVYRKVSKCLIKHQLTKMMIIMSGIKKTSSGELRLNGLIQKLLRQSKAKRLHWKIYILGVGLCFTWTMWDRTSFLLVDGGVICGFLWVIRLLQRNLVITTAFVPKILLLKRNLWL